MAYTNEQKEAALVALAANGDNYAKTAKDQNVTERQLRRWSKGDHVPPEMSENVRLIKTTLADRAEVIAGKLLGRVEATVDTATIMQAATSFAIMVDKMRLLREEPTSINASMRSLTPEQLLDEINAIIAAPDDDPKLKLIGD